MKTLVVTLKLEARHLEQIKEIVPDWQIFHGKNKTDWYSYLNDAEIVVGWNNECIEPCLNGEAQVRWVQKWSAGVNDIPFDRFKQKGIILTNAKGVHPFPISETTFGFMLSLTRKIHTYSRQQVRKFWYHAHNGMEMHGKTVGLIGVGAIGEEIAKIAKVFGMRILGVRKSAKACPNVDHMVGMDGLQTVLEQSDYYVINTLPLTSETVHFMDKDQFAAMKPTAFYINVGRGQTTCTEALVEALEQERIAGAGLDVFEEEPLPQDHPFWEMENVIVTPHTSGSTYYYNDRIMKIFLTNLQKYIAGENPRINRIDLEKRY